MIQREREAEGDEFKDKEAYVTQAYKDQIAELRKAEQEEKLREGGLALLHSRLRNLHMIPRTELEKKKKNEVGSGMAHFYRKLLEESEQQHEQTVAATTSAQAKPTIGPQGPNLTIMKPPDFAPKSDLELARLAREQGKDVELNDDNQIVDKRELLSAGLNLSAPNTRRLGLQLSKAQSVSQEAVQVHRAVGTAASRKEINERRAREVANQMEEERERLLREKEREEQENISRVVAKRNTDESVKSARERYLERKRRKIEEDQASGDGRPEGAGPD